MPDWERRRDAMVADQLVARGITDERVLAAMSTVPRHLFVPEHRVEEAYDDYPVPLPHQQTVSQPYIVAATAEALQLQPTDRVLDVGTGSGYAAAVISQLCEEVVGIERLPDLAESAAQRLRDLGYGNVTVHCADGWHGWPAAAPYDGIAVAAAAPEVPAALLDQLADGGRMVIPVGARWGQQLQLVRRSGERVSTEHLMAVGFVPLVAE